MATTLESIHRKDGQMVDYTPEAAITGGQVLQLPDGRAAVAKVDIAAGVLGAVAVSGLVDVLKAASIVILNGTGIWWDHSANTATCIPQFGDRDFYLGVAVGDVVAGATYIRVALNVEASYVIDTRGGAGMLTGGGDTVLVANGYLVNRGGMLELGFTTAAEAQKSDWLSRRSFPKGANWIVDIMLELATAADDAAADFDVGVSNETHATDFQTAANFAAFHLDGDDLNIDVHSDDGTTDVAPVDSTVDIVAGTPIFLQIDGRDETNIKFYINGVRVASGSTFTLTAASNALKLIFHMEKTSNDSPGVIQVCGGVRLCE